MDTVASLAAALADRYLIERELGAGGMATVYLAEDLKHKRKVALKVLKPELAAVIGGARFLSEIKTTANLQHPHILPLHDSGEVDGTVFYVMPFVDGESLRDRLSREKQLPIDDAIGIASEVADALHYAHGHGVIHRDVKPENILLHGGHALVADFGIALAASNTAGTRMTETGMSLGTPTYMSPEQAMGERDITARSDVYALGCVLYEMLLGEPPFTGPTAQAIVAKVLSERPAPMRGRRDRIPPAVEAAVLTALEKLPADRFGTLAEFRTALTAPAPAARSYGPIAEGRGRRWWRDPRLALVVGLAAGFGGAAILLRREAAGVAVSAAASTQLTFDGRSVHPAISPDGEFVAFVVRRCPIGSEVECVHSLVVQARANARPVELLHDVPSVSAPRWTADGLSLVVDAQLDSSRYGLFVVPRLGGVPRSLGAGGVFDTHATADSLLVVRRDRKSGQQVAHVVSIASGEGRDTVALGTRDVDAVAWSPDGLLLAIIDDFASVTIVRRDGGVADSVLGPFRSTVRWATNGRGILVFSGLPVKEDDFKRIPVAANGRMGAPVVVLQRVSDILRGEFDVARRVGRLAFISGTLNMDLWTFELPPSPPGARQRVAGTTYYTSASISPDGTHLYYLRGDALGDNLYQLTLPDSEEALRAGRLPGGWANVHVSRDNRRVVFGNIDSSGMLLSDLDVASRRSQTVQWPFRGGAPRPIGTRGFVILPADGRSLVRLDSAGGAARPIVAPDSLRIDAFDLSPDGLRAVLTVESPSGSRIGITPLARWDFREVYRFARGEAGLSLNWSDDGWIYVTSARAADQPGVLLRIRDGQSQLAPVMALPPGCLAHTVRIAAAALRGTCLRSDIRGDVWLADVAQLMR